MSVTQQRDRATDLAKTNTARALVVARAIPDPWFRAQALAAVARHVDGDPTRIAREAGKAALACDDAYQRAAVRSGEIAALAERGQKTSARKALAAARKTADQATPANSRAEALLLLLHAAARIGVGESVGVAEALRGIVGSGWRSDRGVREAAGVPAALDPAAATAFVAGIGDAALRAKCEAIVASGGCAPRSFFG